MGNSITHASAGTSLTQAEYESADAHSGGTGRSATLVVAASDATATEIAQADYLCDGVADEVTINTAADLLTGGGILQLTTGTYAIAGFIDPHNNVWIRGMGRATILDVALTNNVGFHAGEDGIAARTGFIISDLRIDGNFVDTDNNNDTGLFQFTDCTNYRLENIIADYSQSSAVYMIGSLTSGVTIRNLQGTGSSRCLLEIAEGKHIEGSFITAIENNQTTNGMDINLEAGDRAIEDVKLSHLRVKALTTSNRACIAVNGDTQNIIDILISHFVFEGGVFGVTAVGSGRTKFSHGIIKGGTNGIRVSSTRRVIDFTAEDIDILDCESRGIHLGAPAAPTTAADNLIFRVNIDGTARTYAGAMTWGVVVDAAPNDNITHCFLEDSKIHDCTNNIVDATGVITQTDVTTW